VMYRFAMLLVVVAALFVSGCEQDDGANGVFKIGLITNNPNGLRNVQGFRDGLRELGYAEEDNIAFVYAGKPTPNSELEQSVRAMIDADVRLIFTAGTPTGVAAFRATRDCQIPVVFGVMADPVAAGVLSDPSQPGGNLTGVMLSPNQAKRLELLLAIAPRIRRVWVPYNPNDTAPASAVAQIEDASRALGLELVRAPARDNDEVSAQLNALPENIDAIFLVPDSTVNRRISDVLAAAVERRLPVSGPSTIQVEQGALMTYGFVHENAGRQAARIASRILKGADPAIVPVENADFYLTVNLVAAERIGLRVSDQVLQRADLILRDDRYGQ